MTIGVLKEPGYENRVSLMPEEAEALLKKNVRVILESGAGAKAFAIDDAYAAKGVQVIERNQVLSEADMLLAIHTPDDVPAGKMILGVFQPLFQFALMQDWAAKGITSFSLDMIPRTTRAQIMDVLSSQANVAGYKAVLLAAERYGRYFPMFMTAAGSIKPAKVLILGAGVAGLQAIATARRLGAVVEVFDTRPAVKEEVMSLGGKFIEVEGAADASKAGGYAVEQTEDYKQKQQARIAEAIAKADIVITTAQIPGKKAPILITEEMIRSMRNGSVIVDLASATGGNTPLTQNNSTVEAFGVSIIGNSNLASTMPADASKMYGKNIFNFLQLLITKEATLHLNWEDDLVKGCCITHDGKVVHERVASLL